MGCDEVQKVLLEARDPDDLDEACQRHVQDCGSCRTLHDQLLTVDGLVKEHSPELPQGFVLSLRRRLKEAKPQPSPGGQRDGRTTKTAGRWWLAAAAALLVVGSVALLGRWRQDAPQSFHKLRLSVASSQTVEGVQFDVHLPDGVRLAPGAGVLLGSGNRLAWSSELVAGINEFELPLVSTVASATVRAELINGSDKTTQTVQLVKTEDARKRTDSPIEIAWQVGGSR